LIEEKLGWPLETIKNRLDEKTFINNNLGGMIKIVFQGSPFLAVKATYPDKLNFWEMKNNPKIWSKETVMEAIKWVVETQLNGDYNCLKRKTLVSNGLMGMLNYMYKNNIELSECIKDISRLKK
jgi:hypothetical protein